MTRILIVGYGPDSVDLTDPGLPPGITREEIRSSTEQSRQRILDHGWGADVCMLPPTDAAVHILRMALEAKAYDCVVIGGGVRMAEKTVPLFENIVDIIRKVAPGIPIAFNSGPECSLEAAQRWVK